MDPITVLARNVVLLVVDKVLRAPLIVLLSLGGAPLALVVSLSVSTIVEAGRPIEHVVALPSVDTRATWEAEVQAFSARLEEGFDLDADKADEFSRWILEASARQQLPPDLVASLIYTESTFRKRVRSWSGAIGPAQVKPRFWRRFCGGVDLTDPEQNVYCGAQIVAHYMERCGDFDCAVRLYNVGPSNLRDPYYRARSHVYLAKIEHGRTRFAAADIAEDRDAPAASAL